MSLVFETWELGQSWILAKALLLPGSKQLRSTLLFFFFVCRYFLSVYKTKNIKLNVVGNGPGE